MARILVQCTNCEGTDDFEHINGVLTCYCGTKVEPRPAAYTFIGDIELDKELGENAN